VSLPKSSKAALREALRARLKGRLDSLPSASDFARKHLVAWLRMLPPGNLLSYAALPDEVDPKPVIGLLRDEGWRICLPRTRPDGIIEAAEVLPSDVLQRGPFGVQEPSPRCQAMDPAKLSVILVPARAIDPTGTRLGRGGGVYDRFLSTLPPRCRKIGLIFSFQLVPQLPREPHDVRLDGWISDEGFGQPSG
jgi:5-formyltetrahydrofolate cyclo-ligase